MIEHEATRTLVKSPPEIWAQCSEAESLDRHLNGSFGEIRITRLEPEHAVAWEGEEVSGTVRIEPSAWGTRVTMTAQTAQEEVQNGSVAGSAEVQSGSAARSEEVQPGAGSEEAQSVAPPEQPVPEAEPETAAPKPIPHVNPNPPPTTSPTLLARLRARFRRLAAGAVPEPEANAPESRSAEPEANAPESRSAKPEAEAPESRSAEPAAEPEVPPAVASEAEVAPPVAGEPQPPSPDSQTAGVTEALNAALESLGQAHHRPYSRT